MIVAAFHLNDWDQYPGLDHPRSQMLVWLQHMKAFGIDKLIMIDKTEFRIGNYYIHSDHEILFEKYNTIDDFLNSYVDYSVVFLERGINGVSLSNFSHPTDNVIYIVGPDFGIMESSKTPTHIVEIPMVNQKALYSQTAMSIALYDRLIKQI